MRRTASAMVAGLALVGVMPEVAGADPMVLTTTQMDAITAAARPAGINLNININIVTQIANARSIAIATCGICIGGPPVAFSLASASNANASQQIAR